MKRHYNSALVFLFVIFYYSFANPCKAQNTFDKYKTFIAICNSPKLLTDSTKKVRTIALETYKLATKEGNNEFVLNALNIIGKTYFVESQYNQAIVYFKQGIATCGNQYPEIKLKLLVNAAHTFYKSKFYENALIFYQQAILLTNETLYTEKAELYYNCGQVYSELRNFSQSALYYDLAIKNLIKQKDLSLLPYIYQAIGINSKFIGNDLEAIEWNKKALQLFEFYKDTIQQAMVLNNLGQSYSSIGKYQQAIVQFEQALKIFDHENLYVYQANVLANVAQIFYFWRKIPEATSYLEQSIQLYKKAGNYAEYMLTLANLCNIYLVNNKTKDAEILIDNVIKFMNSLEGYESQKAIILQYSGKIKMQKALFDKAKADFVLAKSFKNIEPRVIAELNLNIAQIENKLNHFDSAAFYISNCLQITKKYEYRDIETAAVLELAKTYYYSRNFEKAFSLLEKYTFLKDSLFSTNSYEKLAQMQIYYETEKKNREIQSSRKDLEWYTNRVVLQRIIIVISIAGILLLLIGMVLLYLQLKSKNLAYRKLIEKNKIISDIVNQKKIESPNIECHSTEDEKFAIQLHTLFEDKEIYLDKELSLESVAKLLNTNRTYLSEFLNNQTNTHFSDYVNEFRIKKAIKVINEKKSDNITIAGIGEMVGFKNKTTFYSAFKKFSGVTPAFYRKNS